MWNEDLIRSVFYPLDADAILWIPWGHIDEDFGAWQPERHGVYSVKSAYKLLSEDRRNNQMLCAVSSSNHQDYWKKVWKLKVPPKVSLLV